MIDFYLKAATRDDLLGCLEDAGFYVDAALSEGVLLDEIGEIEGSTGYHANLRVMGEVTEEQEIALEPVVIAAPDFPFRVWA